MCLAVPGKIISIVSGESPLMAKADFGGVRKEICLALTPEAAVGDYVLVHAGFAISRIDVAAAERSLALFAEIAQGEQSAPADIEIRSAGDAPLP